MTLPHINGWVRLGFLITTLWFIAVITALCTGVGFFRLTRWLYDWVDVGTPESPIAGLLWWRFAALLLAPVSALWLLGLCWAWVMAGFSAVHRNRYLTGERLSDVLALIQVLAIDEHPHRSEDGLATELQGKPRSAVSCSV